MTPELKRILEISECEKELTTALAKLKTEREELYEDIRDKINYTYFLYKGIIYYNNCKNYTVEIFHPPELE